MEQQLNMCQVESYDMIFHSDLFQEETMEIIVPDSLTDICRIIDADGQLRLTGKHVQDHSFVIHGVLDAWILYEPEEQGRVCRMEAAIPFAVRQDVQTLNNDCMCVAVPVIRDIDCKILNPRKVMLRADLGARVQLYCPNQQQICTGVIDNNENGIQQLQSQIDASYIKDIQEKEFTVVDELRLQNGPSGYGEVISTEVKAECNQAKVIGNKIIAKHFQQCQTCHGQSQLCNNSHRLGNFIIH